MVAVVQNSQATDTQVAVVWRRYIGPLYNYTGPGAIYFRLRTGNNWDYNAVQVSDDGEAATWPHLAVGLDGRLHLVWQAGLDLRYAWWSESSGWSTPVSIPGANEVAAASLNREPRHAVAINSAGKVYVAWTNTNGDLMLTSRSGSTWSAPETWFRGWGGDHLSLVLDGDGNPQIIQRKGGALYHIAHPGNLGTVKRYFADGQQVAMRVNGDVYYTPTDPTGTSVTVVDESGQQVGEILYDAYGGVLASNLTTELTKTLFADTLPTDPDAGLVYVGNGRWYDPLLGRPLQPNPSGGPPTVPQALNRYAATSFGQPGVAQAAVSSLPPLVRSLANQVPGATLSYQGIPQLAQALTRPIWRGTPATTGLVEIVGARTSVRFLEAEGFETLSIQPARGLLRGPLSRIFKGLQTQTLRGEMVLAGALADDAFAQGEAVGLGRGVTARLVARNLQYGVDDVATKAATRRLGNVLGVGAAGLLSAGLQGVTDYNNPYLTGEQKWRRAEVSFFLGTGAAGTGLLAEYALIGSVGGPVGIIAAIPVAIGFELWVAPLIFENRGLTEQRKLVPLN